VTHLGQPFTDAGFGNWFRDRRIEAVCPDVRMACEKLAQLSQGAPRYHSGQQQNADAK